MTPKLLLGRKVYSRDENELYPICKVCRNELSPFAFDNQDIGVDLFIHLEKANLILEKQQDGDIIILICKHCCKYVGIKI